MLPGHPSLCKVILLGRIKLGEPPGDLIMRSMELPRPPGLMHLIYYSNALEAPTRLRSGPPLKVQKHMQTTAVYHQHPLLT